MLSNQIRAFLPVDFASGERGGGEREIERATRKSCRYIFQRRRERERERGKFVAEFSR